jgi:hypothetical protein
MYLTNEDPHEFIKKKFLHTEKQCKDLFDNRERFDWESDEEYFCDLTHVDDETPLNIDDVYCTRLGTMAGDIGTHVVDATDEESYPSVHQKWKLSHNLSECISVVYYFDLSKY